MDEMAAMEVPASEQGSNAREVQQLRVQVLCSTFYGATTVPRNMLNLELPGNL